MATIKQIEKAMGVLMMRVEDNGIKAKAGIKIDLDRNDRFVNAVDVLAEKLETAFYGEEK